MWNLIGRTITVNLVDGTAFVGRVRFAWSWRVVVLDRAVIVSGDRRIIVEGRVRIPAGSVLFSQITDDKLREVGA